jgi:hypothetical protein
VARVFRGAALAKADRTLRDWALRNGYRLIEVDYNWVQSGPFLWSNILLGSFDLVVYRVKAAKEGWIVQGWVCCGGAVMTALKMPVRVARDARPPE